MTHIWLITFAAVIVILALAVIFSIMVQKSGQGEGADLSTPAIEQRVEGWQTGIEPPTEIAPIKPVQPAQRATQAPARAVPETPAVDSTPLMSARERRGKKAAAERPDLQLDRLAGTLRVDTSAIMRNDRLSFEHTCYRKGTSLPVSWTGAPARTKTFVLVLEEHKTGAPVAVNWVVYNIPATAKGLPAAMPRVPLFEGGIRQGMNDQDFIGYNGPCVPMGRVNYVLRLFALDTVLELPENVKFAAMIPAMNNHIIDAAERRFVHYMQE